MKSEKKPSPTLLASSPTMDGIKDCIREFYCGSAKVLFPRGDNLWAVGNIYDDKILEGVRVVKKRNRYRFEMLISR